MTKERFVEILVEEGYPSHVAGDIFETSANAHDEFREQNKLGEDEVRGAAQRFRELYEQFGIFSYLHLI